MKSLCCLSALLLLGACDRLAASSPIVRGSPTVDWPAYAGDAGSLRYSALADITPQNVGALESAWTWSAEETDTIADATGERVNPGRFQATPLAFGDTLFFSTSFNRVIALDGRLGRQLWSFDPRAQEAGLISADRGAFVHRGVASWVHEGKRLIFHASRGALFALDAATGAPIVSFGNRGRVDLTADLRWPVDRLHFGNTSPPVVYGDIVIVGSAIGDRIVHDRDPPGDVQAFDARSGRRLWRWDPVPPIKSVERATWEGNSANVTGHANVWAPFSVDVERGLVFLPVSSASNDFYGGNRLGDNLYSQSLVCLNARSGALVWARQLVHHDLWDYDPASPPVLTTTQRNGRSVDEVLLAGKTGFLYAFNRSTGEPVWPLAERSVPSSDVAGERAARTQPHPTWPLPFARQGFSERDVIDFTPDVRERARRLLADKRLGPIFSPPSLVGTVQMPGWIGGAGWGSTAVDPIRQVAYIKATNMPILARLRPTDDTRSFVSAEFANPMEPLMLEITDDRWWALRKAAPLRIPVSKPPYGTLTAIDLPTGRHKWSIVLGDSPAIRHHPAFRGAKLPALGVAGAPGGVATASGLIFITGGGDVLYAIDGESGRKLWAFPLGQVGYSNPMTFRASDGRQYVVVATGEGPRATLQAFTLRPGNGVPERQ